MKNVGGDIEIKNLASDVVFTDSGRSSLRLILRSLPEASMVLVPDFICGVVLKILEREGKDFSFYHVKEDLTIDFNSVSGRSFDIFYAVNYFGNPVVLPDIPDDKIVVEDNVFLADFERPDKGFNWVGFNSFRKISPLSEGSMIKSDFSLNTAILRNGKAEYASLKRRAAGIKYDYIHNNGGSEKEYLELFEEGERLLDFQRDIFRLSDLSVLELLDFFRGIDAQEEIRKNNFSILSREVGRFSFNITPLFHSFYPLSVPRRDALRKHLFSKKVFPPVHWPGAEGVSNSLYDSIISIPVDPRYGREEMLRVAGLINDFYAP